MTLAAIEFDALVKDYGDVRALDGVDLKVEEGEILGFLGPNGAGKTTAIRCLLDLIRPTAGRTLVCGLDSRLRSVEARRNLGYLPGELNLYETFSGRQIIDFFVGLRRGQVRSSYLESLLERLALDPSKRVEAYSKGNRQKLGLVVALMHQPRVLVLDEPTSGLDPIVHEEVAEILEEAAVAGQTVFFSSHVMSEVERVCHRVAIIRRGRLVAVEEIAALKGRSLHIVEISFGAEVPPDLFAIEGVKELHRHDSRVQLQVSSNLDEVIKAVARYPVVDLRTEQPTLEQIFLAYYDDDSSTGV
jgi:beta-exotoxin I transport system ATP-binding protein